MFPDLFDQCRIREWGDIGSLSLRIAGDGEMRGLAVERVHNQIGDERKAAVLVASAVLQHHRGIGCIDDSTQSATCISLVEEELAGVVPGGKDNQALISSAVGRG